MMIQGSSVTSYLPSYATNMRQNPLGKGSSPSTSTSDAGVQLSISDQAKSMAAGDTQDINARLDAIKAKPAVQRTAEESEFVVKNDSRLAQIVAKGHNHQTAEDVDYVQKTGGFVNTMANLSPNEKKLYDQLVEQGNTDAVRGMNLIALSRMGSGDVTLPNGKTFDPTQTEITAQNIRALFSQMFVSSDGQDARSFEALASHLDGKKQIAAS